MLKQLMGALLGAGIAGSTAGADTYGKYETPPYSVNGQVGLAEVRDYGAYIMADVTVEGQRGYALRRGFRELAGYIFGGNQARSSVSMTAPVAQSQGIEMTAPVAQSQQDGLWTVSFMMPSEWTLDTLPEPNVSTIRFREVAPRREAVWQFSGRATDTALANAEASLRVELDAEGVRYSEPARYYFYDDPLTLPWNRRNEVAFVLD